MKTNTILQGDVLIKLKEFPKKSINMCMTSPPYWALRDYGDNNSQIWDGKEDCEHDFEIEESKNPADRGGQGEKDAGKYGDWKGTSVTNKSGFCSLCGAWKGQLGLEPTFDLYIKHLCDIFEEVKRVLRDDGTGFVYKSEHLGENVGSSDFKYRINFEQ